MEVQYGVWCRDGRNRSNQNPKYCLSISFIFFLCLHAFLLSFCQLQSKVFFISMIYWVFWSVRLGVTRRKNWSWKNAFYFWLDKNRVGLIKMINKWKQIKSLGVIFSLSLGNAVRQTSEDSRRDLIFLHFILRRKYYKKEIRKNIKTIICIIGRNSLGNSPTKLCNFFTDSVIAEFISFELLSIV